MNYYSKTVPKGWKPNDPYSINKWFNKLPIVRDYELIQEIDERYEYLKLKV